MLRCRDFEQIAGNNWVALFIVRREGGEAEWAYRVAGDYRPIGRAGSYRDHARQCLDAAVHAASVDTCSAFLELAFGWTRLAKRLEAESTEAESLGDALQSVSVVFIKPRRD
jgi:hypothetical protein